MGQIQLKFSLSSKPDPLTSLLKKQTLTLQKFSKSDDEDATEYGV